MGTIHQASGNVCRMAGHTLKPGTPEHGTTERGTPSEQQNIHPRTVAEHWTLPGTPAEHPRIPTEYQRNTSGTPQEQRNHTKRVQANQLSSPKTIRQSMIFWQFQRVQKSNNSLKRTHEWSSLTHQGWTITLVFLREKLY